MEEEILLKLNRKEIDSITGGIIFIALIAFIFKTRFITFPINSLQLYFISIFILLLLILSLFPIINTLNTKLIMTNKCLRVRTLSTLYKYEIFLYEDIDYIEIMRTNIRGIDFARLRIHGKKNKVIDIGAFGFYDEFKSIFFPVIDFLKRREGHNLIIKEKVKI